MTTSSDRNTALLSTMNRISLASSATPTAKAIFGSRKTPRITEDTTAYQVRPAYTGRLMEFPTGEVVHEAQISRRLHSRSPPGRANAFARFVTRVSGLGREPFESHFGPFVNPANRLSAIF